MFRYVIHPGPPRVVEPDTVAVWLIEEGGQPCLMAQGRRDIPWHVAGLTNGGRLLRFAGVGGDVALTTSRNSYIALEAEGFTLTEHPRSVLDPEEVEMDIEYI